MNRHCPVCNQKLPPSLDERELKSRVERLIAPTLARQQEQLDQGYQQRLEAAKRDDTAKFESQLEQLERESAQERAQHQREIERLEKQFQKVNRQLKKRTSEQLGDEAEVDLLTELRAKFPDDHIDRI